MLKSNSFSVHQIVEKQNRFIKKPFLFKNDRAFYYPGNPVTAEVDTTNGRLTLFPNSKKGGNADPLVPSRGGREVGGISGENTFMQIPYGTGYKPMGQAQVQGSVLTDTPSTGCVTCSSTSQSSIYNNNSNSGNSGNCPSGTVWDSIAGACKAIGSNF